MISKRLILSLLAILLIAPLAWSQQERALRPVTGTVDSNIRQALVIGNSEYRHAGRLRNPVNDARAIGSTLQQLGFDVTLLTDADQRKMERTIREFGDQLRQRKGVGLFYYAGHGMQFDGENYLLPTDINPSTEDDVRYDAVPLGKMLARMRSADNAMNVVILDACRNNPFSRSFRTFSPGLAQVNAAAGTFISFATAPGQVAADGDGNNGLFTGKLLEHLQTPGLKIEEVFKRTTTDVYTASNQRQAPWVQYSVIGDFYFTPREITPAIVGAKPKEFLSQQTELAKDVALSGEAAMKQLLETKECIGCDLQEAYLVRTDLRNANLSKANLTKAYLRDTDLREAKLREADFRESNLVKSDLTGADSALSDLRSAILTYARLRKTNLYFANLNGADLVEADLSNANLNFTNLRLSDLSSANLRGASMEKTKLNGAKFCNTTMPDGSINNQDCDQSLQQQSKSAVEVVLSGNIAKQKLLKTRECVGCDLRGVDLTGADLIGVNLTEADLSRADLWKTYLSNANLEKAVLEKADLRFTYLNKANLQSSNLTDANLKFANLVSARMHGATLSNADLTNAKFCETTMPDGSINNRDC